MKAKPIIRGLISYVPGLLQYLKKKKGKNICGGTDSARYCYSIWMRHLINLNDNFGNRNYKTVAEIGPGDSLGMGIMALITGAEKYYAFDVKKYINTEKNIQIYEELIKLFISKERIPDDEEFPLIEPKLTNYEFPSQLFESNFDNLINEKRLEKIKKAIEEEAFDDMEIKYIIPWDTEYKQLKSKVDLVFTQAVMEHLNDLEKAYYIMYNVLKDGGCISHEIDFSSHETHEKWFGHLNYGNILWKIIMHGRPYDINRMPHSKHMDLIKKAGFSDIKEKRTLDSKESAIIENKEILVRFTEDDLRIENSFIQAIK
jgi:hypothetical protein